jgi:predicted DsbA family dithiol-disulfide isomerase
VDGFKLMSAIAIAEKLSDFPPEPSQSSAREDALEIIEYTDPFCSWAWSSEPTFRRLRRALGGQGSWRTVLGVLIDDRDEASGGRDEEIALYYERWNRVVGHTGAPTPLSLEWPVASSWPATRAAKAVELLSASGDAHTHVVRRLRESLFLYGRPADTDAALGEALAGVPGIEVDAVLRFSTSAEVARAVEADWEETRRPLPEVIGLSEPLPHPGDAVPDGEGFRYRFPTIVVRGPRGTVAVPGWRSFESYTHALATVAPALSLSDGLIASADEALELFETLTQAELAVLTGTHEPPRGVGVLDVRGGKVWTRRLSQQVV